MVYLGKILYALENNEHSAVVGYCVPQISIRLRWLWMLFGPSISLLIFFVWLYQLLEMCFQLWCIYFSLQSCHFWLHILWNSIIRHTYTYKCYTYLLYRPFSHYEIFLLTANTTSCFQVYRHSNFLWLTVCIVHHLPDISYYDNCVFFIKYASCGSRMQSWGGKVLLRPSGWDTRLNCIKASINCWDSGGWMPRSTWFVAPKKSLVDSLACCQTCLLPIWSGWLLLLSLHVLRVFGKFQILYRKLPKFLTPGPRLVEDSLLLAGPT